MGRIGQKRSYSPQSTEEPRILIPIGHFVSVICEDEADDFWLCQVRENITSDRGKDEEIDITWLIDKHRDGIYVSEHDVCN